MPLNLLEQLIAIPSVNPMGAPANGPNCYEAGMTRFLLELFQREGWDCAVDEVAEGRANVLARIPGPADAPCILLDAHQDTVPVSGMTIDPFQPRVTDGRIYGRGACDVKGGMAAMIAAVQRLHRQRPGDHPTMVLACTCDEEYGQLGARRLAEGWSNGNCRLLPTPPDLALVAEPTELQVVVAHRGTVRWRIATDGVAAHSSDPARGVNAIYRMARVITALEEYAKRLPQSATPHHLCGPATLSVGRIQGGTSVNIVPDHCQVEIDRRLLPGESPWDAMADVASFLRSRLEVDFAMLPPDTLGLALSDDENGAWAHMLLQAVRRTHQDCELVGVPFGTHAARYAAQGAPSLVFGPGSIAQAHTKDEWLPIQQLQDATAILFDFLACALERPAALG